MTHGADQLGADQAQTLVEEEQELHHQLDAQARLIRDDLRLQCGGLQGLRSELDPDALAIDVQRLLERLHEGGLEALAWEPILRAIGQWQPGR